WNNTSNDTIYTMPFHLYYNAFRNSNSTFMKEGDFGAFLGDELENKCGWAWMEIKSIMNQEGKDLMLSSKFIQPDDGNPNDQTVLEITLANPIPPGASITLDMEWESKIPRIMPRTGYNKEFFFMAQWFPKVGVYEAEGVRCREEGGWNCHQYHSDGEYYADFGNYDVTINVPKTYVVGASGELKNKEEKGDRSIWNFYVEDVIDYAWTASPHYAIQEDQYKDTKILLYSYDYKCYLRERYITTLKFAMEYLEDRLGPYPYPTLTVVDPPIHGIFTGGMEYPTLITSLSFCFFPRGIKTPETLIVHEYIHQYFMQMVASHEVEDTWLDEGFTTYWEGRILDALDGPNTSTLDILGIKSGNVEWNRAEFFAMDHPKIYPNAIKSWEYKHGGYGQIAYNKTAIWLKTLEGLVGVETMDEIMGTYFKRLQFQHPCREDFINITNEIVTAKYGDQFGPNMNWFFDQVLFGTDVCDYKLASIESKKVKPAYGYVNSIDQCLSPENTNNDKDFYESVVIVHRLGEIQMPQEVLLYFDNGEKQLMQWDGKARSHDFTITGPHKIIAADIDPERKIHMDKNFINNSYSVKPQTKGIRKYFAQFMIGLQNVMESISWLS
ncbi:MAG: M1 family metallopeptidase, partial [Bacteroidota bacterium]